MNFVLCVFLVAEAMCAPVNENKTMIEQNLPEVDKTVESEILDEGRSVKADTTQAGTEKNPVQQWFENLSKNVSTGAQNAMSTFKEWITNLNQNNNNQASQNLPTLYTGGFQLLKMPMPQFGDVVKGMSDLVNMAQTFNKVTGGLPQGLPLPQGIPLIS